jgi:hypothetical protein
MNLTQALQLVALGIAALKAIPQVDPKILGYIQTADDAINSALAAVQQSKQGVDPTLLKPIDPVL